MTTHMLLTIVLLGLPLCSWARDCTAPCANCSRGEMFAPAILDTDKINSGDCIIRNDEKCELVAERCVFCVMGQYQDVYEKNETCKDCGVGQYAETPGLTKCERCPVGKYMTSEGAAYCRRCPVGKFKNNRNNLLCSECAAGKSSQSGDQGCTFCEAGKASKRGDGEGCSSCQPGTASELGQEAPCPKCKRGKFQPLKEMESCKRCPDGKVTSSNMTDGMGPIACMDCDPGQHTTANFTCETCEPGTHSFRSEHLRCPRCARPEHCPGGDKCQIVNFTFDGQINTTNRTGFVCHRCPTNHYTTAFGSCEMCPYQRGMSQTNILLGVVFFAIVFVCVKPLNGPPEAQWKQGYEFIYVLTLIFSIPVPWPPVFYDLFRNGFQGFVWPGITSAECEFAGSIPGSGYAEMALLSMLGLFAIAFVVLVTTLVGNSLRKAWLVDRSAYLLTIMCSFLYARIATLTMQSFDATERSDGRFYFDMIPDMQLCELVDANADCVLSDIYLWSCVFGLAMFLIWVVGVPYLLLHMANWGAKRVKLHHDDSFKQQMGWFYLRFNRDNYWWEITIMLRKLGMVMINTFQTSNAFAQLMCAMALTMSSLELTFRRAPYVTSKQRAHYSRTDEGVEQPPPGVKDDNCCLPSKEAVTELKKARARKLFKKFDSDSSGTIESLELTACLDFMGVKAPTGGDDVYEAWFDSILAKYDTDGDQTIEFDEFFAIYQDCEAGKFGGADTAEMKARRGSNLVSGAEADEYNQLDEDGGVDDGDIELGEVNGASASGGASGDGEGKGAGDEHDEWESAVTDAGEVYFYPKEVNELWMDAAQMAPAVLRRDPVSLFARKDFDHDDDRLLAVTMGERLAVTGAYWQPADQDPSEPGKGWLVAKSVSGKQGLVRPKILDKGDALELLYSDEGKMFLKEVRRMQNRQLKRAEREEAKAAAREEKRKAKEEEKKPVNKEAEILERQKKVEQDRKKQARDLLAKEKNEELKERQRVLKEKESDKKKQIHEELAAEKADEQARLADLAAAKAADRIRDEAFKASTYIVTSSEAQIHVSPSSDSEIISIEPLFKGTAISVLPADDATEGWVKYDGGHSSGWVSKDHVKPLADSGFASEFGLLRYKDKNKPACVVENKYSVLVNCGVYAEPDTTSKRISSRVSGDTIRAKDIAVDREGNLWVRGVFSRGWLIIESSKSEIRLEMISWTYLVTAETVPVHTFRGRYSDDPVECVFRNDRVLVNTIFEDGLGLHVLCADGWFLAQDAEGENVNAVVDVTGDHFVVTAEGAPVLPTLDQYVEQNLAPRADGGFAKTREEIGENRFMDLPVSFLPRGAIVTAVDSAVDAAGRICIRVEANEVHPDRWVIIRHHTQRPKPDESSLIFPHSMWMLLLMIAGGAPSRPLRMVVIGGILPLLSIFLGISYFDLKTLISDGTTNELSFKDKQPCCCAQRWQWRILLTLGWLIGVVLYVYYGQYFYAIPAFLLLRAAFTVRQILPMRSKHHILRTFFVLLAFVLFAAGAAGVGDSDDTLVSMGGFVGVYTCPTPQSGNETCNAEESPMTFDTRLGLWRRSVAGLIMIIVFIRYPWEYLDQDDDLTPDEEKTRWDKLMSTKGGPSWMDKVEFNPRARTGPFYFVVFWLSLPASLLGKLDHPFNHAQLVQQRVHMFKHHLMEFSFNDLIEIYLLFVQVVIIRFGFDLNGADPSDEETLKPLQDSAASLGMTMILIGTAGFLFSVFAFRRNLMKEAAKYNVRDLQRPMCGKDKEVVEFQMGSKRRASQVGLHDHDLVGSGVKGLAAMADVRDHERLPDVPDSDDEDGPGRFDGHIDSLEDHH